MTEILICLFLVAFVAPVLLLAALLIKIDSRGPVFFRQERLGLNERVFTILKLRSMKQDAERLGPAWAALQDPRITRVGSYLRKYHLDELPQLLNVIRGEMSLVGPRPERQHFADRLVQELPTYRSRCKVKPGITGWAQVNYPYGSTVADAERKLVFDLYYIANKSLIMDLSIVVKTIRVVLLCEGSR
jgi:lipopolysaccharide/colanic/teichoic acid biosynthesis glycosyltransferase